MKIFEIMAFQLLRNIYYGVPRLVGDSFRTRKRQIILLGAAILGVPFVIFLTISIAVLISHSDTPIKIAQAALYQIGPDTVNGPPPQWMNTLTPAQLALGRYALNVAVIAIIVLILAAEWDDCKPLRDLLRDFFRDFRRHH